MKKKAGITQQFDQELYKVGQAVQITAKRTKNIIFGLVKEIAPLSVIILTVTEDKKVEDLVIKIDDVLESITIEILGGNDIGRKADSGASE